MATTLQLGKTATIKAVEDLLSELSSHEGPRDLRVPQRLAKDDFGGHAAFLQLLATWVRTSPDASLITYISPERADDQIETFTKSDHGLVAALLAARVVDVKGNNITSDVRQAVLKRLHRLNDRFAARQGSHLLLVAADHTAVHAAPDALYQVDPKTGAAVVGDAGVFSQVADRVVRSSSVGPRRRKVLAERKFELGLLLMELFANTHDWARTRPDFTRLDPSVRLIRAEGFSRSQTDLTRLAAGDTALETYLSGNHFPEVADGVRQYLEIDVLDTGAGLTAGRLYDLGINAPSLTEEFEAAQFCLSAYGTTWKGHNRDFRGLGMVRALEHLTAMHGFIRLRTGRLSLYRDLLNEPYETAESPAPFMRDWVTGAPLASEHPRVQGTLFTIILPAAWESHDRSMGHHDATL